MKLTAKTYGWVLSTLACLFLVVYGIIVLVGSGDAAVGINKTINFQGKVTNPNGTNVTDGTYEFDFALYTVATAGTATWTETVNLVVTDGIFQHNLGSVTALPGSVDFNSDNIYLGVQFNNDAAGEMTPRIRMTASPYAFNADMLDGLDSTDLVELTPASTQTGSIDVSGNISSGGTIAATTALQSPLLDTASATALGIGTTNATAINLNENTVVASTKTFTVTSGATSLTGAASGVALTISNSTSTGNIANFNDNATTVFSLADGGAASFQNSVDSTTAFLVQRASTGGALFTIDSSTTSGSRNGILTVGVSDTNATLFVLDTKTSAGDPTGSNGGMYYNSADGKFRCYEGGAWKNCISSQTATINVRSFIDTTADALVDANTTSYWDQAAENNTSNPNFTPSAASGVSIMGILSFEITATGATDVDASARIERGIGSVPTCGSGTQVGGNPGGFTTNTGAIKSSTVTFMDTPNTTSTVYYVVCSDSATAGTAANVTRLRFTLQEVVNSN
ncbi:MAG: hypothetical protein M3Q14_04350 [bacterium]|nr:hypothetical protein [bacterium]